jgi:hypothetical protein
LVEHLQPNNARFRLKAIPEFYGEPLVAAFVYHSNEVLSM